LGAALEEGNIVDRSTVHAPTENDFMNKSKNLLESLFGDFFGPWSYQSGVWLMYYEFWF
jgi:hypothetical protein